MARKLPDVTESASRRQPITISRSIEDNQSATRQVSPLYWIVSRVDRDSYLNDLGKATKQIQLQPSPGQEEGSVARLTILKLDEESPMFAAGFRNGDRILKVNGTSIRTMKRAFNLLHEVKAADVLTVQVQRGEEILDYRFELE